VIVFWSVFDWFPVYRFRRQEHNQNQNHCSRDFHNTYWGIRHPLGFRYQFEYPVMEILPLNKYLELSEESGHGLFIFSTHDPKRIRNFPCQFHVIPQIGFRLFAVALPQFREGFAIAVLCAHPQVFRDGIQ
jgi:hypothetical protein